MRGAALGFQTVVRRTRALAWRLRREVVSQIVVRIAAAEARRRGVA